MLVPLHMRLNERVDPQVGGFMRVRRALLGQLSDAAYDTVQSFHSDSAVCFSIFLHHLPDLTSQHPPHVLLRAMEVLSASCASTVSLQTSCHFSTATFVVCCTAHLCVHSTVRIAHET